MMVGRFGSGGNEASGGGPGAVRVRMLGGFSVSVGSRTVEEGGWRLRKAESLVKLLALAPPRHRLHRERAMDLLWPDLDPEAAANNLHQALHVARRTLDPTQAASSRYLRLRGEQLELCPEQPLQVDVEAFEEAAADARRSREPASYRAALDLYTGDLLPQDPYEHWAEDRREGLRKTYLSLLVELAGLHEEREEYAPAIGALGNVVANEPAHEGARVGLMRLYALSGQRGEALRQYERLAEALSREYAAEPAAPSRHLYEEIVAGRFPPSSTSPPASSLPEEPPAARRHNLPAARTSFIRCERELDEVKRLLSATRLLTLTGAGGCGKTRLALEVAGELIGSYPDGAWLVELAGLSEGTLVPQEVADALEVREQPNRPLVDTLVDALGDKKMLLVLDNCEHVIGTAAHLVDTLLDSCPGLRVLATSREVLGLSGEANWRVPSLSLPDPQRPPTVEELERYESARLFSERARHRDPAFALTPQNAPAVAQICRRLDGIPLAIELAAARVGTLTPEQISERLGDPLKLLTGGSRTARPRQRTLRGALDWSYELLSEPERALFERLSAFAGGWTLEAAEAVGAGSGVEKDAVLDLLGRLVDKSLVVTEAGAEQVLRYRMLEPVRQYGWERLEEIGEEASVRCRHASWFLGLAEQAAPELTGPRQLAWAERLESEHDNLRAALSWASEEGAAEHGLRLGAALGEFWRVRGHLREGWRWLEAVLARGGGRPEARARALVRAGTMAWENGDFERAATLGKASLALSREVGDGAGAASALFGLGWVALFRNEHDRAAALYEEAASLWRDLGDRANLGRALQTLGLVALARRYFDRAWGLYEESLRLAREAADETGISLALGLGALVALGRADGTSSRELARQGVEQARRVGHPHGLAFHLHVCAAMAAERGNSPRSARLWGAAGALRDVPFTPFEQHLYGPYVAAARALLDDAAWEAAWAEGRAMTQEAAVEYALLEEEEPVLSASHTPERMPPSPPWADKHNLPIPRSSFVGRERELGEVKRLLTTTRLLTLTGAGGCGKTRLALEAARRLVGAYPDGVWLVELAPLSEGELVPQEVADALEVREQPNRPLIDTLMDALSDKKMLLVLDNCEHLVSAAARLVDTLLGSCPDLRILATSREALGVEDETNWRVPSLSLPDPEHPLTVEKLEGYDSARLFVERAQRRDPTFVLTPRNIPAVAKICRRLEGIPLAIELAVARIGTLSVEQISGKLEDSLKLLTTGGRTAEPRQQTLKGTLDWSHELLNEPERKLFRRVSVFAGGWTLEAVEAVGTDDGIEKDDALDLLSRLVDKSLVVTETGEEEAPRYRMLEPVRQYGRERLEESGEAEQVRRRHADHYLALAETAEPELLGARQGGWLRRLRTELGNLRGALSWSVEPGQEGERAQLRLRLVAALWRFWDVGGFEEGKQWLQMALEKDPGGFPVVRAKALSGLGWILLFQRDYRRAITVLEEAITLHKELGDESGAAFALANLGYAVLHGGYRERVPALVEEAEALMQRGLDSRTRAFLRMVLASAAMEEDDLESARAQLEENLALCRELGDLRITAMSLFTLGMVELKRDDLDRGAALLEEGARIARELGDRLASVYYLLGLGKVAALRGKPVLAARLWGAAETLREQMEMSLSHFDLVHSRYK